MSENEIVLRQHKEIFGEDLDKENDEDYIPDNTDMSSDEDIGHKSFISPKKVDSCFETPKQKKGIPKFMVNIVHQKVILPSKKLVHQELHLEIEFHLLVTRKLLKDLK